MKRIISLFLISILLSGCFLRVHKLDIKQGNIITQEDTQKLHIGMTEAEVKQIMGIPVMVNLFAENRLDYIYTYQPPYGVMSIKRLTCVFNRGRLERIIRD